MAAHPKKSGFVFTQFFKSDKSSGILLILCTILALAITNSPLGGFYLQFWQLYLGGLSLEHWINDALMAIFFLLIGLELERELYSGKLSNLKNAMLPIFAALGGIVVPALIHFNFNAGTPTQAGLGIPMATDIAFALGILALLGSRVPTSLKVFLAALAIIDDLGAVIIIALFYTAQVTTVYLFAALGTLCAMLIMNRLLRISALLPYLLGGVLMWFFMMKSGVHATVAGVLLAFAIPYSHRTPGKESPSHKLEHLLHKPVAFLILPLFALANTGIIIGANWTHELHSSNSLGIIAGLVIGKPLGITLMAFIAVSLGICRLPVDVNWKHIWGAGLLGGIGFTMSIFITNLAFVGDDGMINSSKMAILLASLVAGIAGYFWLKMCTHKTIHETPTI